MPCFFPLHGWYAKTRNESGKRSVVFDRTQAFVDMPISVPCGQCRGCRMSKAGQWALRCNHEALLHNSNCFITLTFSDQYLAPDRSLHHRDFQLFMNRLRRYFEYHYNHVGIRFYHAGEYGDLRGRPHHHALLFNCDFPDRKFFEKRGNFNLDRSPILESLWPYGFSTVGSLTMESAAYVARYCMKKINGKQADEIDPKTGFRPYEWCDDDGVLHTRRPEYNTMSRRPGIAREFYNKYKDDMYPSDFITFKGKKFKPPKFYDGILEIDNPDMYASIKKARKAFAINDPNNHPDRLAAKKAILDSKLNLLPRPLK